MATNVMLISTLSKTIINSKFHRPSSFSAYFDRWLGCSHSSVLNYRNDEHFKEKQAFHLLQTHPIYTLSARTIGNVRKIKDECYTKNPQKRWKNTETIENDENESTTSNLSYYDDKWYEKFSQLSEYYKENQDSNVPLRHPTLGNWTKRQRKLYKTNKLPDHRIEALKSLNFQFDVRGVSWESMRKKLQEYKDREGHLNVPKDHPVLGHWVVAQRHNFKFDRSRLSRQRMKRLEEMGFIFDLLEYAWQLMYNQLKEYMQKYGDCNVPATHENRALSKWVSTQRSNYKALMENPNTCYFPKHRRDALDDIGFLWDYYERVWLDKYDELIKYQAYHGHCNVPFVYQSNPSLGIWVSTQRQQYNLYKRGKPTKITADRMKKLEDLGFVWNVRATQWQEKYEDLKKFIQMNGHSNVPHSNKPLSRWVATQRNQYSLWKQGKHSRLTEDRRKKLDEIAFYLKLK